MKTLQYQVTFKDKEIVFYLSFFFQIIKDIHFQNELLSSDDGVWKVQENEKRLKNF